MTTGPSRASSARSAVPGDKARVTVFVAVEPRDAFDVFTLEIDSWWRHGKRFRGGSSGRIEFRGGAGGALVETSDDGERVIGAVRVWDPGERLVFEWRAVNFAPDESTEVEVTFTPKRGGTEVVVEHRGWSTIRDDHPARHGDAAGPFLRHLAAWWGDLASSLRESVASRG